MFRNHDVRYVLLLLGLSLLTWIPRFRGPIDLRYDAGVYYILGTSLAEGKGYRLLNEPGKAQAIQYPPLLPAFVAFHQWALGTSDHQRVGQWLRITYAILFTLYVLSVYVLARMYLTPGYSFLVTLIVTMYVDTIFLSDLLFTEIPFALVTILFFLSNGRREQEILSVPTSLLGMMAYLLRSTGIALLAAWVAESLLKRRWKQAAVRVGVSLIPVVAWQFYIGRVQSGEEYKHPAYAYQRAPYQYYNVGYIDNILLVDPFVPELGKLTPAGLAVRVVDNLALMPESLGRVVIGGLQIREWLSNLERRWGDLARLGARTFSVIPVAAGFLVLGGMGLFLSRRDWLIPMYVAAYLVLICLTPWPGQFKRYVTPLFPFLALSLVRLLAAFAESTLRQRHATWRLMGPAFLVLVAAITIGRETLSVVRTYLYFHNPVYRSAARGKGMESRLFFYDLGWSNFDESLAWLKTRANTGEVIATKAPHWAYLSTGLKAVMPPMEVDPAVAQQLLDSVPVDYLIIDQLVFLDIVSRYAEPVIRAFPDRWSLLYTAPGGRTQIYRRLGRGEGAGRPHDSNPKTSVMRGLNRVDSGPYPVKQATKRADGIRRGAHSKTTSASQVPSSKAFKKRSDVPSGLASRLV